MIFAALLFAAAAPAAVPGPDCNSDALPQQDMNYCAVLDWEAADRVLNEQWARTTATMRLLDASSVGLYDPAKPGYYRALLEAQRAWLEYRDKQCVSEGYTFRGGSMEPFMVATCKAHLTKLRTEELRELEIVE